LRLAAAFAQLSHHAARAALILAAAALLSAPCGAANLGEGLGTDELERAIPGAAAEVLDGMGVDSADLDSGLARVGAFLCARFHAVLAEVLRPLAAITAVTLLFAALRPLTAPRRGFDGVSFGACAAVSAIAVSDAGTVLALGRQTMAELADVSHALLPTLTAAACAAGAPTSAGVKYAAGALFSDLMLLAANNLVLPLICAYLAAACADAALGGALTGAAHFTAWAAKTMMKALVLCFTGYLGLTGIVAAGADAAAVKTTKAVISTLLPVVGKTVADASASLVAGAGLIRNSIGVFGLLSALAVLALPLLRLGLRYLLFRAAAALLAPVAGDPLGKLIGGIAAAYGMVLGLVGSAAAILFLSVFALIRTVSG